MMLPPTSYVNQEPWRAESRKAYLEQRKGDKTTTDELHKFEVYCRFHNEDKIKGKQEGLFLHI